MEYWVVKGKLITAFLVFFTLSACGGGGSSEPVSTPGGNNPVALDQTLSVDENTSTDIILSGTDSDGTISSYTVVSEPSHGTLSGVEPNLAYTPAANYTGSDSFTFTVTDNNGATSTDATVSITVNSVASANQAPTATGQSVSTNMNTAKSITLSGTDSDGSISSYTVASGPTHGSLSGTAPDQIYTPASDYTGSDSFTFTVTDNDGATSSAATVSITVNSVAPANQAPTATAQSVTTDQDIAKAITLSGTDSDGTIASYTYGNPSHGTLFGTAPNLTYTPTTGYTGSDSFSFTVTDNGGAASTAATVSITVNAVNSAPIATAQSVSTAFDTSKAITLAGTDSDGTIGSYTVVTQPIHGVLGGTPPNLTYTPNAGYSGSDSFTFTVTDNGGATSTAAAVSITVAANVTPTATAQSVSTAFDTAKAITLAGTDSDGTISSYTVVSGPSHGSLGGTEPNLTYTPTTGYSGSDSFTFTVTDNGGATSTAATVSITVNAANTAPTANTDNYSDTGNTQTSVSAASGVLANDSDTQTVQSGLTVTAVTGAATTQGGSVTISSDGSFTYTPPRNFSGSDSFSYTLNDNDATGNLTATGTVNISVSGMVWYVDDSAAAGGDGRSSAPYNTLAAGISALSSGETLFLYAGNYTGGVALPVGASLIGEGSGLSVTGLTIPAGIKPTISAASATKVITLANGNTINGVTISGGYNGIYGNAISGFTLDNTSVQNSAYDNIDLIDCSGTISLQNGTVSNTTSTNHPNYGFKFDNAVASTITLNITNMGFAGNGAGNGMDNAVYMLTNTNNTLHATINGSIFTNLANEGIFTSILGTTGGDSVTIGDGNSGNANTFTGVVGNVIDIEAQNNTNTTFTIKGNSFNGNGSSTASGVYVKLKPTGAATALYISNNTFNSIGNDTVLNTYPNEVMDLAVIRLFLTDANTTSSTSTADLTIDGNTLNIGNSRGIHINAYGGATIGATVNNNTVTGQLANHGLDAYVDGSASLCLAASNNSTGGSDVFTLHNTVGTLNINGASSLSALSANNNSMTVSNTGTGTIGYSSCNLTP